MADGQITEHLALLAGFRQDGEPAYEVVPAERRPDGLWQLRGTPALAQGCAAGDLLSVDDTGGYTVAERGGNVSVVSYAAGPGSLLPHAEALKRLLGPRATVETHPDGRWLVATVPVGLGFAMIEEAMAQWGSLSTAAWSYGNVYDDDDQPLNWW
ncbi:DUF4265 domain-containing protein [Actinotalea solisilvae]|uniref:DUF4265 domain-containing protein n=1 Tax=Actinotalea solisilvae TaxID=2072922 RepID=UPI0018F11123|nr:DUF4265 domain-containing protein [Actinotalea solisilvae]